MVERIGRPVLLDGRVAVAGRTRLEVAGIRMAGIRT